MDQVRTIEAGALPARFARGWHCLGLAGGFRDGGPHAVAAFGTKLVVFADSAGPLHVLGGCCRHMGGDLTQGTVKGDAIACPFHDWRWGGDGRGGETALRSEASYDGPAYMIDYMWHDYHGMSIESVLINCHYPVTPTSFLLQWGAIVRRPPGLSDAQASRVAAKFADFVGLGFQQDVEIWLHKTRIDNPLLCAEDGPVYQVRRWYEQFYRDVADVEPDMTARFEFEIDTSRAVAGWEAEVAANLAQARADSGHAS